jgi:hypothetical protein
MVAGEGSSFVANDATQGHLGNTSANHLIHVADHGNFETKSTPFNIGQALSAANTNNMVLVETEGTATFHNTLNIGRANSSSMSGMIAGENKLIIRSGGKVEAKNGINVGGKWYGPSNLVEVTDGGSLTVGGASFRVGGVGAQDQNSPGGSSWNRVRVVGGSYSQLYGAITIGDVNGKMMLAHVATFQGTRALNHIQGKRDKIKFNMVPAAVFTIPEVASVGLTEKQARDAGYEIKVGKFPLSAAGKASAAGHNEGFIKVIFDAKYGEWLGTHMICYNVT